MEAGISLKACFHGFPAARESGLRRFFIREIALDDRQRIINKALHEDNGTNGQNEECQRRYNRPRAGIDEVVVMFYGGVTHVLALYYVPTL